MKLKLIDKQCRGGTPWGTLGAMAPVFPIKYHISYPRSECHSLAQSGYHLVFYPSSHGFKPVPYVYLGVSIGPEPDRTRFGTGTGYGQFLGPKTGPYK